MKTTFNFTTYAEDTERFADQNDLTGFIDELGFDGLELMYGEPDEREIIPRDKVIGLHMSSFVTWLDLWRQNEAGLIKQFGSLETAEKFFGSLDRAVLIDRYRADLAHAHDYGAEYVVFHAAEENTLSGFNFRYDYSDEEVIAGVSEILNEVFAGEDGSIALLMENLWQPGLTLTRPEITRLLLNSIDYPNAGIMMDTGHLLHTDFSLQTQSEGVDYILRQLDAHGPLVDAVRGIHLQQSLTGKFCQNLVENPYPYSDDFEERYWQMFEQVFLIDRHEPWSDPRVREIVERVAPEYVTFEFITDSRATLEQMLRTQRAALYE